MPYIQVSEFNLILLLGVDLTKGTPQRGIRSDSTRSWLGFDQGLTYIETVQMVFWDRWSGS